MFKNYFEIKEKINNKIKNKEILTKEESSFLLEEVIDTLIEVGNGVTDEQLHESADYLLYFRDFYFKNSRPTNDFETKVLDETFKRQLKTKPTLKGRK